MKIKENGFLWRLASVYGPMHEFDEETDICTLTRATLLGVLCALLIIAVGSLVTSVLFNPLIWVTWMVLNTQWIAPSEFTMVVLVTCCALSAAALITYIYERLKWWVYNRKHEAQDREPSAVVQMYRAWKGKYCFRVEIERS